MIINIHFEDNLSQLKQNVSVSKYFDWKEFNALDPTANSNRLIQYDNCECIVGSILNSQQQGHPNLYLCFPLLDNKH